ncbi:MAG: DUF2730 family protein [Alphaproteobacteria bacterium]|nr:DUF2730 family protein [Alphaproteobacteria bacterium]
MNADDIKIWLSIGGAVLTLASLIGGWALWSLRQAMVPRHEFDGFQEEHDKDHGELEERLKQGELRFERMEAMVKNLPDHDDLAEIRESLSDVEKAVASVSTELKGVADAIKAQTLQLNMLLKHHLRDS